MSTQYCKIGRTVPRLNNLLALKDLENKYLSFLEEAYNTRKLDAGLSDYLYFEASKLKQRILKFKTRLLHTLDAA